MAEAVQRYAVVSGANRGIGLEIVRQLASAGIKVVLTARDEKRGLEALQNLKAAGLSDSDLVVFHQLDVADAASVASLTDFIKSKFGKLDILVNNAGTIGFIFNDIALALSALSNPEAFSEADKIKAITETYELAEECLQINYYGAKRTAEYLLPLLQLSDSPRVVNVSSSMGKLESLSNEWAKGILSDVDNLTEEGVDKVLKVFLKDFKEGSIKSKNWPEFAPAYRVSKAALNAFTRILAKKHPTFSINCVCPGYVNTDINCHTGILPVEEGAASPVRLALQPSGSPSGLFYSRSEITSF